MPDWKILHSGSSRVGVLLFDRFSNHCLANAVEPLRAANTLLGRKAYDWQILTLDGTPVTSSSGFPVVPSASLADAPGGDALFLLPSYDYRRHASVKCSHLLRAAARRYDTLVGLDTGSWLLAEAGLLDGRPATIHYEVFEEFSEQFPDVVARRERFIVDGNRVTSGGAMTAFELVLRLIGERHGTALTLEIAALFMHQEAGIVRSVSKAQGNRHVAAAIAEMESHVEQLLPIRLVAKRAGCSQKDLERWFARVIGAPPRTVYRRIRLTLARRLMVETAMSVAEVALRCGYADTSAFTRAFKAEFGVTPRAVRQ
jgi:AraC family transcriptional regulator, carnitine catabolism transcriptional activator